MAYVLRSCVWEITLACCFSCKYCGSNGGKARENELTTEECLNVADQLASMGCRRVSLIGGEVFMRKDWADIVDRLTSQNVKVSIITNGFLFDDRLLEKLKSVNIESVAISLDATKSIHDKYRQVGSYSRAIQALDRLTKAGFLVSIISTLNRENVNDLANLYAILREYPVAAWQLQACSPMGNAAKYGIDYQFDVRTVIDFVRQNRDFAPFPMGIADNIGYYTDDDNKLRGNKYGGACFAGCRAGLTSLGIDSIGNVRGCESMYDDSFIEGNLRDKPLKEIWESPDAFAYNRRFVKTLLTGRCQICPKGPYCAGGCRSYNYFVHGMLYESPRCVRNCERT